jgi:hypothetical protein
LTEPASLGADPHGGDPTRAGRPGWRAWAPLAAAILPLIGFLIQGHIGLSLRDEGFVWYGAQRVFAGDVPLRDFQAYDIGRYYWSAAWMFLSHSDGIVALRLGNAVLAGCTVGLATWLVASSARRPPLMLLLSVGLMFTLWMVPDFKVSDSFAAVLLVAGLSRLLQEPSQRRHVEYGVCLGVAATIGINHAFYGVVATAIALILLGPKTWSIRSWAGLALGGLVGYSPVLLLAVVAPGFAAAFVDSIHQLFEAGSTNLSLPLPRPWAVLKAHAGRKYALAESLMAALFVLAPLVWLAAAWRLLRAGSSALRARPVLAAALIVSIPYAHYAYSRADIVHLAVAVLPWLIALFAATVELKARWLGAFVLLIAAGGTWCLTFFSQPAYQATQWGPSEFVVVGSDRLKLSRVMAGDLRLVRQVVDAQPHGGTVYVAPFWPGAYAVARQRAPTWEIYLLFSATKSRQEKEIARLRAARVNKALILREYIDNQPSRGFERTHSLIADFIKRCLPIVVSTNPVDPEVSIHAGDGALCQGTAPVR